MKMTEELKITDINSLNEAKVRLKLKAQYHKMGLELEARKAFSGGAILSKVAEKVTGRSSDDKEENSSGNMPYALVGTLVSVAINVALTKIKTGRSWGDVLKHVLASVFNKYKAKIASGISSAIPGV